MTRELSTKTAEEYKDVGNRKRVMEIMGQTEGNLSQQRLLNGPPREEDIGSNTTSPPSLLPDFLQAVLDSPTVCSLSSAARKLKVSPVQLAGRFCKGASPISSRVHLYDVISS